MRTGRKTARMRVQIDFQIEFSRALGSCPRVDIGKLQDAIAGVFSALPDADRLLPGMRVAMGLDYRRDAKAPTQ